MASKKPLPKKYHTLKSNIIELAKDGLSKTVIIQLLELPPNFFNAYVDSNPSDWFNQGRALFAESVMKSVRTNLDFSPTERKYLMEKLGLTRNEVELPKMTDAKSAGKVLSEALHLYARKEIGDVELQAIRSSAQIYSELHVNVEIQQELAELKAMIEEQNKRA